MKYCRYQTAEGVVYGLVTTVDGQEAVTQVIDSPIEEPHAMRGRLRTELMEPLPLDTLAILESVRPSKIVCVGRNYREHAKELGNEVPAELLIFLKPPSALIGPQRTIRRPRISNRVDYEGELGVVIGSVARKLDPSEDVRRYIRGYTIVNDVTARDLQNKDGQWTRAKGFDTFCPVGPVVTDEVDPWEGLEVETRVNGQLRQHGNTRDFIFSLDAILRYISQVMTLYPGDLIATGTPAGVSPVVAGDTIEVGIQGIGTLRNSVVDE